MSTASRPVLAIDPTALRWQSPVELRRHFDDHSRDKGDCLKRSLNRGDPFTVDGYMLTISDTVRRSRFLMRALIRNRRYPDSKNKKRTWAFAPNLFCVGMAIGTNEIVTAFHNHLVWGQHGHKLFEMRCPTDNHKADAFLDWLSRGEALAASAKVMLGCSVSHEITGVERMSGFTPVRKQHSV